MSLSASAGVLAAPALRAQTRRGELEGVLRTNWSRDPFSYGAYSYVARGSRQRDRRTMAAPIVNRIYFAGEAMHPDYNNTVHAALESGWMEAGQMAEAGHRRVAVIGAGIAGLGAAYRLDAAGIDVTVIEARDRIGGRLWTSNALGTPVDLGASWIHGIQNNPLVELADEMGMARVQTVDTYAVRGGDGRRIAELDAPEWLERVETQITAGADPEQLNTMAYWLQDGYGGPDVVFRNGYAPILGSLAGGYRVRRGTPIDTVALSGTGVHLTARGGAVSEFDAVLVTVPLGVLKAGAIRFEPGLSEERLDAIGRLGMGTLDKLYLKFDRPFWDPEQTWIATPETGLPRGQFNIWLNLYAVLGVPILLAFNGGSAALDLADESDATLTRLALETLSAAYPA